MADRTCTCTSAGLNPCATCPRPWPVIPGAPSATPPGGRQFGIDDCTCIPFTQHETPPRYLNQPTDTVDMISGWERRSDCPHHRAANPTPAPVDRESLRDAISTALRAAAYSCDGGCDGDEATCVEAHPIQESATTHGVISDLYGPIDAIAQVVAEVRDGEMERLRGERDAAVAQLARVRALHSPSSFPNPDAPGVITYCVGCDEGTGSHPCPTIDVLDAAPPTSPTVTINVYAATPGDSAGRAQAIADLVAAEYGQETRLDIRVGGVDGAQNDRSAASRTILSAVPADPPPGAAEGRPTAGDGR